MKVAPALERLGIDVYDHLETPDLPPRYDAEILEKDATRRAKRTNIVCWVSVPTHARGWYEGQLPVIWTMWEATKLPESFRETLHEFDTVVVPSDHNVELFSKYHPRVRKAQLGVDPDDWYFRPRPNPAVYFDFLIGGSGKRKGTDLAHKAFRTLWGKDGSWPSDMPIPRLVMKNPKAENFYGDRVLMVTGRMSNQAEIDLYQNAHCYLQPSRGEGFGLQPLQALACGIPTILTDAHGHKDFAHLGLGLSSKMAKADYFIYGDAGEWWEPDFDELCDRMKWVYENYTQACEQAGNAAEVIAKGFTWKTTAERFIDAVGADRLAAPHNSSSAWHTPEVRRYKIVTRKDWGADIAGVMYQFKRGVTYFELADVKRILFEAELLDPICLVDDDLGLTESQLAKVPDYSASHSYCVTCGQKLGTRPTQADEIYQGLER